jgi:rfaE bifunctional protein nucleotidyltransferase chain/domain
MIIDLKAFPKFREENLKNKKIVCTSGFFDPIHPGHISCLTESKKLGDVLIVIVDGDQRAVIKKGKPFIPEKDRAYIVDHIKGVDYVTIYNHPTEDNCIEAIRIIKPDIFTKGGDRISGKEVPEAKVVEEYGGEVIYNVGDPKIWSSSNYLEEWVNFKKQSS